MAKLVLALNDLEMPEDASLTQTLQRLPKGDRLSTLLLDAIDKDWRTGSAHAKLVWDPARQVPMIGNRPTTLLEVSAKSELLLSIWHGLELGVAVVKQSEPALARAINDLAGGWDRGVILEVLASQVSASHGLHVRHVRRAGTEVKIILTRDQPEDWRRAVAAVSEMAPKTPTITTWTLVPRRGSPQTGTPRLAGGPVGA